MNMILSFISSVSLCWAFAMGLTTARRDHISNAMAPDLACGHRALPSRTTSGHREVLPVETCGDVGSPRILRDSAKEFAKKYPPLGRFDHDGLVDLIESLFAKIQINEFIQERVCSRETRAANYAWIGWDEIFEPDLSRSCGLGETATLARLLSGNQANIYGVGSMDLRFRCLGKRGSPLRLCFLPPEAGSFQWFSYWSFIDRCPGVRNLLLVSENIFTAAVFFSGMFAQAGIQSRVDHFVTEFLAPILMLVGVTMIVYGGWQIHRGETGAGLLAIIGGFIVATAIPMMRMIMQF